MCACMYTYVYTCMHVYMCACMCMHVHECVLECLCTCTCVHMCVHARGLYNVLACLHMYVHKCVCVHACIFTMWGCALVCVVIEWSGEGMDPLELKVQASHPV